MALQKWAAPAGSPAITTYTITGDPGNQVAGGPDVTFGADGDIAVGAVVRLSAHGIITTTGSPTLGIDLNIFGVTPSAMSFTTYSAPSGVTSQPWRIDLLGTYDGANVRFRGSAEGITTSAFLVSEVVPVANVLARWYVSLGWDSVADDADSGDIIVIHGAVAEWIG